VHSSTAWAECDDTCAGDHVAHDDAAGHTVLDDQVEHLGAGVELDRAQRHLVHHLLVGAEQQLLAGLAPGVERAGHLGAAEAAVVEEAAVLAGERDALRDGLVDDVHRLLGQAVHVRLAAAEVAALDRCRRTAGRPSRRRPCSSWRR
jgi:hypothetical protein